MSNDFPSTNGDQSSSADEADAQAEYARAAMQSTENVEKLLDGLGLAWCYDEAEDVWIIDDGDGLIVMRRGGDWVKVKRPEVLQ